MSVNDLQGYVTDVEFLLRPAGTANNTALLPTFIKENMKVPYECQEKFPDSLNPVYRCQARIL